MGWVGLVEMPTEERRLVAEEGTLSKNTWPQKIARGFGDHRRAPVKGPVPPHTHTLHNTAYCSTLTHTHSLAEMPAEERRLVAEEGSYSKNTWMQKIARRIGWKRRAPVAGPFQLSRSCCTTGFGRRILAEKTGEEDRKRIIRWRPMLAATFVQDNYTKVSGV
jgi:hypothetical protein